MPLISWTHAWSNTDDGTILHGQDLGNIQADLAALLNGNLNSLNLASAGVNEDRLANGANPTIFFSDTLAPAAGFVFTGLTHVSSAGLNETILAGRAYAKKTSVSPAKFIQIIKSSNFVVALTASRDNYIDLDVDGVPHVSPVTVGNPAPPLFLDSTRIMKATTDASSITGTTDLRNTTFLSVGTPRGYFNQFVIEGNGTGNTVATFLVRTPLVVKDSTNAYQITIRSDITVDPSTTGAGGRDTGALSDSYIYIYAIGDSTGAKTASALVSSSATSPTLPSGYDIYRFIGVTGKYNTTSPVAITNFQQVGEFWENMANTSSGLNSIAPTTSAGGGDDTSQDGMSPIKASATNVFRRQTYGLDVTGNASAADSEYILRFANGARASTAAGPHWASLLIAATGNHSFKGTVSFGVSSTGTFRVRTSIVGTFAGASCTMHLSDGIVNLRI